MLRAPQMTHPSVNWSMFSISPFKSTLFLYLLLCNWEIFHVLFLSVFSSSFLYFSVCSSLQCCLALLNPLSLFRPILIQNPPRTETEISFQDSKHPCLLSEAPPHLSSQISCNRKMWQAWNHPPKNLSVNIIKLATWGNMHCTWVCMWAFYIKGELPDLKLIILLLVIEPVSSFLVDLRKTPYHKLTSHRGH